MERRVDLVGRRAVGGDATFSGTNYQASVIAYVLVHVLTESKLRLLSEADDTRTTVSGEVRGPGDDARIEFGAGISPVEVQAKHGLKPKKCLEAFGAIRDGAAAGDTTTVLLVVDSTSSASIRHDLKRDTDAGAAKALELLSENLEEPFTRNRRMAVLQTEPAARFTRPSGLSRSHDRRVFVGWPDRGVICCQRLALKWNRPCRRRYVLS